MEDDPAAYGGFNPLSTSLLREQQRRYADDAHASLLSPPELQVDDYGFLTDDASSPSVSPDPSASRRPPPVPPNRRPDDDPRSIKARELKWLALMERFRPHEVRASRKVRKLLRHGVPEAIRGKVWLFLADVDASYRRPGIYPALLRKDPLPIYEAIDRDINRCYPNHVQFLSVHGPGQEDLQNVLNAYAQYNPAVGYCQGMGRLAGLMLMHLPAEDAFWLLVATIDAHLPGYFTPTLARLKVDCAVLSRLIDLYLPALGHHLHANDVEPLMYATQWFLALYTMSLPWPSVLAVWDHFYLSGTKLLFRVALAILESHRDHLLQECPTSTELLHFLLHLPPLSLQPKDLFDAAYRIPIRRSDIDRVTRRIYREEAAAFSGRRKRSWMNPPNWR